MAKICPLTGEKTVYLTCIECESRKECNTKKDSVSKDSQKS